MRTVGTRVHVREGLDEAQHPVLLLLCWVFWVGQTHPVQDWPSRISDLDRVEGAFTRGQSASGCGPRRAT
jgi:hypothetical protein